MNGARGTFETTIWVEETWDEPASGTKLTRAVRPTASSGTSRGRALRSC